MQISRTSWRAKATSTWKPATPVLSDGEVLINNLKHGPNVLLADAMEFPEFMEIRPEHTHRGMLFIMQMSWTEQWNLLQVTQPGYYTSWEKTVVPLEIVTDKVHRTFAIIQFVRDVVDASPEMEEAYWKCARQRFFALRRIRKSEQFMPLFKKILQEDASEARRRAVAANLVLFEQDGVQLSEGAGMVWRNSKEDFEGFHTAAIQLLNVSERWAIHIRRDMDNKAFLVRDRRELDGLPTYFFEDAARAARTRGYDKATTMYGPWMITMDDCMVTAILKHAKSRSLRDVVYTARNRVAYLGGAGENDNTPLLVPMLGLRETYAKYVGYATFADMRFAMKMATIEQVYGFLARLRSLGVPTARKELTELQEFATSQGADYDLEHFDLQYWRERLLEHRFSLSEGYLREFFQLPVVLDGLFALMRRLFGVKVVAADGEFPVWDKSVRLFRVYDEDDGSYIGAMFFDPFRRRGSKRRLGFWVEKIQGYSEVLGTERGGHRRPVLMVVCDLTPPSPDGADDASASGPGLLTLQEVTQLFHTFGLALRDLLCAVAVGLVAGTQGLEQDVVDLPAHFLQRWVFDASTLRSISRHVKSGEALPEPAIQTIIAARTFHQGIGVLRRVAQAQIDLDLHALYDPNGTMPATDVVKLIEAQHTALEPRLGDQEINSWPIDGDHASSLYSDLWAEGMAADTFQAFEEAGLDNATAVASLGRRFREAILKPGVSRSPIGAAQDFFGRDPSFDAYPAHLGLPSDEELAQEEAAAYDEFEEVYEEGDDFEYFEDEEGEDDMWEDFDEDELEDEP